MNNNENISKEGWMHKKGGRISNWKKRWVVFSGNEIKYYVDQEKTKLKGKIPIEDVFEFGPIAHESRQCTFALKTNYRLYVFDAYTTTEMDLWLKIFNELQINSIGPNAHVPQSTVGNVQKAILRVLNNIKSKFKDKDNNNNNNNNNNNTNQNNANNNNNNIQNNNNQINNINNNQTNVNNNDQINRANQDPNRNTVTSRPHSTLRHTADRSTHFNMRNPNIFQDNPEWTPKKAWEPTNEKPAWAYERHESFPDVLKTNLEKLVKVAQVFNDEWSQLSEWSRKISTGEFTKGTILSKIKTGLANIENLWSDFESIVTELKEWNISSLITQSVNKQYETLQKLVDGKSSGWFILLANKEQEENPFELTYKRESEPTTDKPAFCYQIESGTSPEVVTSMKYLQSGANKFNTGWSIAIKASRFLGNGAYTAESIKEQLENGFRIIADSWKDYELALSGLEKYGTNSLYTVEIRQHVNGLRRLAESKGKEWFNLLQRHTQSNVTTTKGFEKEREPDEDRPSWFYKFSWDTPLQISEGLSALSMAANAFNSAYSKAKEAASQITPTSNIASLREIINDSFAKIESTWSQYENALQLLKNWNSTHSSINEITEQISQLKALVEKKKVEWNEKLDNPQVVNVESSTTNNSNNNNTETNNNNNNNNIIININANNSNSSSNILENDLTNAASILENVMKAIDEAEPYLDKPEEVIQGPNRLGFGSFKVCHVYKEAILLLRKAKNDVNTPEDIRLQIEEVEKAVSQTHIDLCTKWSMYFSQNGNVSLGFEYYLALNDVLPEECHKLDQLFNKM